MNNEFNNSYNNPNMNYGYPNPVPGGPYTQPGNPYGYYPGAMNPGDMNRSMPAMGHNPYGYPQAPMNFPQNYPMYNPQDYMVNTGRSNPTADMLNYINQYNMEQERLNRIKMEEEAKQRDQDRLSNESFKQELSQLVQNPRVEEKSNLPLQLYVSKSEYIDERDRYFFEELIMQPLKTAGVIGTSTINLDKSQLYKNILINPGNNELNKSTTTQNHYLHEDKSDYFFKMTKDGIYLDYIKKLIHSYNLQKVEQRALNENKNDWFKLNGDIRLENDIFSDVITRPIDISLATNDRYAIHYLSNQMSERGCNRTYKTYKMKMFLSRIILKDHQLFSDEDRLASIIKDLHREYYEIMNKLQIPHLKDKMSIILQQLEIYENEPVKSDEIKQEIKYIKMFMAETAKYLEEEKANLNRIANEMYNKWLELKRIRDQQKYQSNTLKLNVLKFNKEEGELSLADYAFVLSYTEPTLDARLLPRHEIDRRNAIQKLNGYVKIYVNNVFVTKSQTFELGWPSFELDINTLFNLNVYTRPTKIEIELYIGGKISFTKISRFEIEAPGIFMNTITSSAPMFEEVDFSSETETQISEIEKKSEAKDITIQKDIINENRNEEVEGLLNNNNNNNLKKKGDKKIKVPTKGRVLVKVEWEGRAPEMPPTKIEDRGNLYNKQFDFKRAIEKIYRYNFPYDLNDPRNIGILELIKKRKTELLLKHLFKEYLITYWDVESLRHFIFKQRQERLNLKPVRVPITEKEIENNHALHNLIKEIKKDNKMIDEVEREKRVKDEMEILTNMYSGKVLTEEEHFRLLAKKIKILKKDIVVKVQLSYFQIINEFFYDMDVCKALSAMALQVIEPERKLKPTRQRKQVVKVERTEEICLNLHIIKGYNIPVRFETIPHSLKEQIKANAIKDIYRSNAAGANPLFRGLLRKDMSGSHSFRGMGAPMPGVNMSGGYPQVGTGNNSFNQQNMINPMYNHPYGMPSPYDPNYNLPMNPNLNNMMYNPNMGNAFPMYNTPNQYMNPRGGLNNIQYDGDIIQVIDILRNVEKNVESFIEVKVVFYNQELDWRTDSVDGLHPDYNARHKFVLKPKDGEKYFTREELSHCPGDIYFTLYDEVRSEQQISEKDAHTYVYKYEKKYLGSFKIPLTTVLQNNSSLEAICKVDIPLSLFGYYSDSSSSYDLINSAIVQKVSSQGGNTENINRIVDEVVKIVNPAINAYISLYITLDPVVALQKSDEFDYVPGFEDSIFLINSMRWLKKIRDEPYVKDRNVRIFVSNFDGFSVYLPRYLKPQQPPEKVFSLNDPLNPLAIEKAARFVALIPFVDDSNAFDYEEVPDCWCYDDQFFSLGFGDYEEHAILLCNYFNYIDKAQNRDCTSYLLLGKAQPEGYTTYVLRMSNTTPDIEIWNAKCGECYYFDKRYEISTFLCFTISKNFRNKGAGEAICPLKEIGCIVNHENVFINIQETSDPSLMEFNLKSRKEWLPFLT
jgi:hypothetical protein